MRSLVVVLALAATAAADGNVEDSKAEADKLFFEGRALLEQGKSNEACAKFELAFKRDPYAIGILMNLGLCKETIGKVATAHRLFSEARQQAKEQGLAEYQAAAESRIALLAPRLPRVEIVLAETLPDTRVLVDDLVLLPDQLANVYVDPGAHTILVTARERLPFETKINVDEGKRARVEIPKLAAQRVETVVVEQSRWRLAGKLGVGIGGGLFVAGLVIGVVAREQYWDQFPDASRDGRPARDAAHNCWTEDIEGKLERLCNGAGSAKLDSSRTLGHVGTAVAIIGAVGVVGGAVLWIAGPRDTRVQSARLVVSPTQVALQVPF